MAGIYSVIFIVCLYGFLGLTPVSVNVKRRKEGKNPYWFIFLAALAVEVGVIYLILLGTPEPVGGQPHFLVYIAPVIGALLSVVFYSQVAKRLDENAIQ